MKKYIIYILVATGLVSVSGCKDYLNINTNPNQLTVAKPDFILSGALVTSAAIKLGDMQNFAGQWSGYYSASGSYSQSGDVTRTYQLTNGSGNGVWGDLYSNLSNYNYVEQNVASLKGYDYYIAICEIMKVHNFQQLVDIFGNVPYKQTLTGFTYLYPKYDDAQAIYTDLSSKLDSAIAIIQGATAPVPVPATTDVMFSGDMSKWIQFANTLNLRILLRQSLVNATPTAELAKISANNGGFLTADAFINPGYAVAQNQQSPLWENYGASYSGPVGGRDYLRLNQFSLDLLNSLSDPRATRLWRNPGDNPGMTSATSSASLVGIVFGALPATLNNSAHTSGWGPGIVNNGAQPAVFFSLAQSYFLQAEAALYGWIPGTPATLYNQGIAASFALLGAGSSSAYSAGNAAYPPAESTVPQQLSAIITQKYIGDWGFDPMEAWSDWRRTGYPANIPTSGDPTRLTPPKGTNPIRLLIPQSEYNNNDNNATSQGQVALVLPQFNEPIFWDKN